MSFEKLREISNKSIVSDFKLKIKITCVCLLQPFVILELYNLCFMHNKLVFPILDFGVAVWSFICMIYLILMIFSDYFKRISLKPGIDFLAARRKIMSLLIIFSISTAVFSAIFIWELKSRNTWQQEIKEVILGNRGQSRMALPFVR